MTTTQKTTSNGKSDGFIAEDTKLVEAPATVDPNGVAGDAESQRILDDTKRVLVATIWEENIEQIKNVDPAWYTVENARTKVKKKYLALSPDRARALAYMDQGFNDPLYVVDIEDI